MNQRIDRSILELVGDLVNWSVCGGKLRKVGVNLVEE